MMRTIKSFFYKLVFLFILLASLVIFLVTTTPGLFITLMFAKIILPGELQVEKPQGQLFDDFAFAKLAYKADKLQFTLTNFNFKWRWNALLHHQLLIETIQASELEFLAKNNEQNSKKSVFNFPKLPFDITVNNASVAKIKLVNSSSTTQLEQLNLQAKLNNQLWQISKLNFNFSNMNFVFQAKIKPISPYSLSANLQFKFSNKIGPEIKGFAEVNGDLSLYHCDGIVKFPQGNLTLNLVYNELANPKIQGKLQTKSFDLKPSFPIQQFKINGGLSGDSFKDLVVNANLSAVYFGNLLQAFLSYQKQQLKGTFSLGKNQLVLSGSPPYNWQLQATIPEPKLLHPQLQGLQTTLTAKASISAVNKAAATFIIQPGNYRFADASPLTTLQFTGGQFRAELNQEKLQVNGQLTMDQNKSLLLTLALPQFQLDKGLIDSQTLQGDLTLKVNSLGFLENFNRTISKIEGQLNAVLKATGTLKKPVLEGALSLDKARLLMTQLGIDWNPIQVNLQSRDKGWEAQGWISSQGQRLNLSGKGNFLPEATGSFTINATNFPLLKTDEYLINISPQLVLNISPKSLDLTGTILIPSAQIKPQTFSNTVSLSTDAVFVRAEPASAPNPLHINTDIQLEMGNDVALGVMGLQGGFLMGAIRIRQLPLGPLNASGELTIRDGKYKAYGQDLTIDQGELLFTGGLINNPGINIRASRRFNASKPSLASTNQLFDFNAANNQTLDFGDDTTVGILVTGRLKSPKIELFSEPSTLSQADILSMLILGKPASQANKAGGQLLLKAITSMNLGSGTRGLQLLDQLKQTLGLDIDIKTSSKFNQETKQVSETNAVVVGKSLSKRIYLSYNFGLSQTDSNVITLTYLLNKFFSIQVNASVTASSADLLYTHKKDNSE